MSGRKLSDYLAKNSNTVHAHGAANATRTRSGLLSPRTRIGIHSSSSTQDVMNMNLAGALVCNDIMSVCYINK